MNKSPNLNLNLPDYQNNADVEHLSENFSIIDNEFGELERKIAEVTPEKVIEYIKSFPGRS
jgi:hypothetical protein